MPVILSEPLALRILRELDRSFYGLTAHKSEEELCALWGLMQGLRRAIKEADEAPQEAENAAAENTEEAAAVEKAPEPPARPKRQGLPDSLPPGFFRDDLSFL